MPVITALGDFLISWNISNAVESQKDWFFPSFEVQEYLLPIIHVGGANFDEYGQTKYSTEDCRRLINTTAFAKETLLIMAKKTVRYETVGKGLVTLDKSQLIDTLDNLSLAAKQAVKEQTALLFYGD